eukprot:g10316.t1
MVNYYELLGVGRDCPPDELKKAYKKAALKHHPDKGGNAEMFKEVSLAYETLNDEAKRLLYDRTTFGSLYGGSGMSGAGGLGTNFGPPNMGPSATATSSRPPMPKKPPPGGTGTSSAGGAAGRSGSGAGPPPGRASRAPPNLEEMSIRELKELLTQLGIRSDDCFERAELISKVKAHFPLDSSGTSSGGGQSGAANGGVRDQPHHQQPPFRGQAWDAGKYQSMTEAAPASDLHGNTAVLSTSRVKVISMGASNSGKSCLIKRFCEGRFVPRYISTIGVDYGVKTVFIQPPAAMPNSNVGRNREQKQRIKVNFFDLSGHDDFRDIRVDFYENTQGVLLCYDASNVETFKKLQ